jgi:signal peptidase II
VLRQKFFLATAIFSVVFVLDQYIKYLFVDGFRVDGECISLVLAYNKGVAFSMFAFLEGNLKYIQIAIMFGVIAYLWLNKDIFQRYFIPAALVLAGGSSNIVDRFIHEGVVDYVYWHCGFDFAIFNFADVMIDLGVVLILIYSYYDGKKENKTT